MGRVIKPKDRHTEISEALQYYGIKKSFANHIAKTYVEKGAGTALVELYAGGWEVTFRFVSGNQVLCIEKHLEASDGPKKSKSIGKGNNRYR